MAASTTAGKWSCISEIGLNQQIDDHSTTQAYPIGHKVLCRDVGTTDYGEAEFVYLGGVASVATGNFCVRDGNAVKRALARDVGPGCVAMAATVASEYGWFQVTGNAVMTGTAADTDNSQMFLTATAGVPSVTAVTGDTIIGCRSAAAVADEATILVVLNHPRCGDTDNSA